MTLYGWSMSKKGWLARACGFLVLVGASALPSAQEPYDEDEWWDPTDWFDGNNVEWDDTYEWYDEGRDDDGYGWHYEWDERENEWEREYGYFDDYYDYDSYSSWDSDDGYGWHYEWDDESNAWDPEYGWYDEYYESEDDQYGWHYEWDPNSSEWDREYGWYDEYYERVDTGSRRTGQQGELTVTGRIDSFSRVSTKDGERLLLRLRTQDGRTRVVDLGSGMDLAKLDLDRGEMVTMRGTQVFRASSIRVAGQPFEVTRGRKLQRSQGSGGSGTEQQKDQGMGQMVTFEGTLEGFKELDIGREKHMLVRMTMQDGTKRVVDLGPRSRLGDLRLENGDQVTVRGHRREIEGEQVLVAQRFDVGDRQFQVSDSRAREASSGSGGTRTITGEIEQFQRAQVEGFSESDLVLELKMMSGRTHVVNFGQSIEMSELGIDEGTEVRISGTTREVSGQQVVTASDVRIDGREIALQDAGRETGEAVEAGSRRSDEN